MARMPPLSAKERAQLPDSAFAYVDSRGRRRLPIHDAAHVRNALARFGQVAFEDDDARDRARSRLLRAAKKHGIMPIGFISSQLQPQRKLPTGARDVPADRHRGLDRAARTPRRRVRAAARRRTAPGARGGAPGRRPRGVRPGRRRSRGVRARSRGTGGSTGNPAGHAGRPVAQRERGAAANRPAPRPARAHRQRLRGPLDPRRGAHLLRGARRPDRAVLRRSHGGQCVASGGRRAQGPRRLAVPRPARADRSLPGGRGRPARRVPPLRSALPAAVT